MKTLICFSILLLALSSCDNGPPVTKSIGTSVPSISYQSKNNSSYGIDQIKVDGVTYIVLQDSNHCISIIPEVSSQDACPGTSAEIKSYKFRSPNNSGFGIDEVAIDGVAYLILQDRDAACIIPKVKPIAEKR